MGKLTWRTSPRPKGLAGVVAAGKFRTLELHQGDDILARVDYAQGRGYYWYGGVGDKRHNSLWDDRTYPTSEEAKDAAKEFVKAALGDASTQEKA